MPLNNWRYIACARYREHTECENYLLEKGCPEPTDEQYAFVVQHMKEEEEAHERIKEAARRTPVEQQH